MLLSILLRSIEKSTNIGIDNQLLFLSNGCSLVGSTLLSSITGTGTDTNPIFLVRRVSSTNTEIVKENLEGINELFRSLEEIKLLRLFFYLKV